MSTWFYLECFTHAGPLQSQHEISQHDDYHLDNAIRLAQGLPVDRDARDGYFEHQARWFLEEHGQCVLGIVNEYGEHRPIPGRDTALDRPAVELELSRALIARTTALQLLQAADARITTARGRLHALDVSTARTGES